MSYNGIPGSVGGVQGHHFSGPVNAERVDHGHYGGHAVAPHSPQQQHWPRRAAGLPNKPLNARKAVFRPNNKPGFLRRANAFRIKPKRLQHHKPVEHAPAFPRKGYPLPGLSPHGQKNVWSGFQSRSAPVNPHTQYFNPSPKQQISHSDSWQRPAPVKQYPQAQVAPASRVKLPGLEEVAQRSQSEPTYSSIEDLDLKPKGVEGGKEQIAGEGSAPVKKKSLRKRLVAVFRRNKSPSKEDLQVARNLKQGVNGPRAHNTYEASKSVAAKREQPAEEPLYAQVDKQKKLQDRAARVVPDPLYDRLPAKLPENEYDTLAPKSENNEANGGYERLQPIKHDYDTIPLKKGADEPHYERLKYSNRPLPPTPPPERSGGNPIYEELKFTEQVESKPAREEIYDSPRKGAGSLENTKAPEENIYDVPRSTAKTTNSDIYDVPQGQPRERSDSLGAVSTASTDSGISDSSEFSDLSDVSSLSSVELDLDEMDQMTPAEIKAHKKSFKKLLEKNKKAAKSFYKAQHAHEKEIKIYLKTLKEADEVLKAGDAAKGLGLINQAFTKLEALREHTISLKGKVAAAIADTSEVSAKRGGESLPEWFNTYEGKVAGQLSLNDAIDRHYVSYLGTPMEPYDTYGERVIELGKQFTGQFLLFTGRVK